jgi:choline transporter-like protein 2/4/5
MAIAKWYFSRDKKTIGNGTVFQAIRQSFFYHTGTAAFGALIIAIIKMIRAALAYAQKKAKATQASIGVPERSTSSSVA